jgi:peptidoglycan/xylan/chitin deacetylase (PgdA/CDA1 family)
MVLIRKIFISITLVLALAGSSLLLWISQNHQVPILMYHDVASGPEAQVNIVTPESFRAQMAYLKQNKYRAVTFDDLVSYLNDGDNISRKAVVVTFDDGHAGIYHHALPILREFNLPAIVFMPSGYIGKEGHLTLEQMLEMQDSGLVSFGSHTVDHAYLPDLSAADQERQMVLSKQALETALETEISYFAYPSGGFNDASKDILKKAGYRAAVTTNRGFDREQKDLYELKRVSMREGDSAWYKLRAKFSGYYNLFRSSKKPY